MIIQNHDKRSVSSALYNATYKGVRRHHVANVAEDYEAFNQVKDFCAEKQLEFYHVDCGKVQNVDDFKKFFSELGFGQSQTEDEDPSASIKGIIILKPLLKGIVLVEHITEAKDRAIKSALCDLLKSESEHISTGYNIVMTGTQSSDEEMYILGPNIKVMCHGFFERPHGYPNHPKDAGGFTALEELKRKLEEM